MQPPLSNRLPLLRQCPLHPESTIPTRHRRRQYKGPSHTSSSHLLPHATPALLEGNGSSTPRRKVSRTACTAIVEGTGAEERDQSREVSNPTPRTHHRLHCLNKASTVGSRAKVHTGAQASTMQTGRLTQPPQDDITPPLGMRILCNAANKGEGGPVHTLCIPG